MMDELVGFMRSAANAIIGLILLAGGLYISGYLFFLAATLRPEWFPGLLWLIALVVALVFLWYGPIMLLSDVVNIERPRYSAAKLAKLAAPILRPDPSTPQPLEPFSPMNLFSSVIPHPYYYARREVIAVIAYIRSSKRMNATQALRYAVENGFISKEWTIADIKTSFWRPFG